MSNDSEAEVEDVEDDAADEEPESGFQSGDVIKLAYTARTVDEGSLVDTTDEDVADEEGIDTDQQEWGPRTIVLGEGHIFPDVEQDIFGKEVGDEGSVTVSAEDAFGEYDESQVRTVSKDKIEEDDRYPGAQVQIDGEQGRLETIIGGRARVDFNHPLAGEAVEYEYEIVSEVTDREEKAQGILSLMLDMELDVWFEQETVEEEQLVESEASDDASNEGGESAEAEPEYETVEVEQDTLYIEATPQLSMNQQWMMGKQQIAQQLTQLLGVDRIIVQEEIGGGGMGMPGMMGGGLGDIEEQLEDADVDAEEIAEELENAGE
ncbi:peptidylprolyl isomerase [Halobacteriales archaeon QS_6_64_34]|nr:MAG: peptidylprolyl isomerase [Halobacteriales archaeon QS_6_64_34]